LIMRGWALWFLGHPEAALRDAESALSEAREIGQAVTLMFALGNGTIVQILCRNQNIARARAQEQAALADEKVVPFWNAYGLMNQGCSWVLTGAPSRAVELLVAGIAMLRATHSKNESPKNWLPFYFLHLARANAELGQFEEAFGYIDEAVTAVETTKEKWCEAEVHRTAGEIELMLPAPNMAKAEAHFERALAIARAQQAKSWELRAATSMARMWRDQCKRESARDVLAPIYSWFTEGFDTLDLKEAKALLDALAT
jgi:predicted ATPase